MQISCERCMNGNKIKTFFVKKLFLCQQKPAKTGFAGLTWCWWRCSAGRIVGITLHFSRTSIAEQPRRVYRIPIELIKKWVNSRERKQFDGLLIGRKFLVTFLWVVVQKFLGALKLLSLQTEKLMLFFKDWRLFLHSRSLGTSWIINQKFVQFLTVLDLLIFSTTVQPLIYAILSIFFTIQMLEQLDPDHIHAFCPPHTLVRSLPINSEFLHRSNL